MKKIVALLLMMATTVAAEDVRLGWDTPTQLTDGTSITGVDSYNIYYSVDGEDMPVISIDGDKIEYVIYDLTPGTYRFRITSVLGFEGDKSNELVIGKPATLVLTGEVIY